MGVHYNSTDSRVKIFVVRLHLYRTIVPKIRTSIVKISLFPPVVASLLDHGAQQVIVYDMLGRRTSILVDTTNSNYILIPVLIASGAT